MRRLLTLALLLALPASAGQVTWPDLSTPPASQAGDGRNDAALIIGIQDYTKVDDVLGARDNAEDWFRWLAKTRGVPLDRVHRLIDSQAVDHKIRSELAAAVAEVRPGGTLWVVFIGHGAPSRDGQDGLLIGADADRSADGIYQRSVPRSEVLAAIEAGRQGQAVVVLDACFSGQGQTGGVLVEGLQNLVPTSARVAGSKVTLLTGAGSGEFAGRLPGTARPAFSYLALGALRGWGDSDGDGKVTAGEVAAYTRGALRATVTDRSQTPSLDGPDVALSTGREAGPDLVELAVAAPTVTPVGAAQIDLGGSTDFAALAAQAQAAEAAKRQAEEAARQAAEAYAREERRQLDQAAAAVRGKATSDFRSIAGLVEAPTEAAVPVLQAYVAQYGAAKVTVGATSERVSVPEVARVEAALAAVSRSSSTRQTVVSQPQTPSWSRAQLMAALDHADCRLGEVRLGHSLKKVKAAFGRPTDASLGDGWGVVWYGETEINLVDEQVNEVKLYLNDGDPDARPSPVGKCRALQTFFAAAPVDCDGARAMFGPDLGVECEAEEGSRRLRTVIEVPEGELWISGRLDEAPLALYVLLRE